MMKFNFINRTLEQPEGYVACTVIIDDEGLQSWFGDENEIRLWKQEIEECTSYHTRGNFDQSNLEHWKLLPKIFHGTYSWCALEENSE